MTPLECAIAARMAFRTPGPGRAPEELTFHVAAGMKRAHNLLAVLRRLKLVDHGEGRVERGGIAGWRVVVPAGSPGVAAAIRSAVVDWLGRSVDPWREAAERAAKRGYHRGGPAGGLLPG